MTSISSVRSLLAVEPVEKHPIPDLKARNQLILLNAKEQYYPLLDFFDRHVAPNKKQNKKLLGRPMVRVESCFDISRLSPGRVSKAGFAGKYSPTN